jgi:hypothetical protein
MLSKVNFAGVALAAGLSVASSASAVVITNTSVADRPTLLSGFTELNLATYASNSGFAGLSGANSNTYVDTYELISAFPGNPLSYSGTLTAEVFGNVANTGVALTDVVIVYTFQSNAFDGTDNLSGTETFAMGINSGFEMDYNYLVAPSTTHGNVIAQSAVGQSSLVEAFDNGAANDTFEFDYTPGAGRLGGPDGDETYTWYVSGSAGTKINVIDVTVTDFGNTTTTTLGFVSNVGQPDLDVPAPGVLALASLGLGAIGARRRRS